MSAVLAPQGATPSTAPPPARNQAQIICTLLLKAPLEDLARVAGCDVSGASRMRANERPLTLDKWLKVVDWLGYKLVGKDKLCMPADEARMLRRAYNFISSSDDLSRRFAATEETPRLEWDEAA